jgi:hypothetical protein
MFDLPPLLMQVATCQTKAGNSPFLPPTHMSDMLRLSRSSCQMIAFKVPDQVCHAVHGVVPSTQPVMLCGTWAGGGSIPSSTVMRHERSQCDSCS